MRPVHGKLLAASGVIHIVFGLLPMVFGPQWLAFAREGFFNIVPHPGDPIIIDYPREAAFWFVLTGVVWIALGDLVDHVERKLGVLPRRFILIMLAIALASSFMMPFSGLPILIPQAMFMWWRARARRSEDKAAHADADQNTHAHQHGDRERSTVAP